jgi:hypothetical protein
MQVIAWLIAASACDHLSLGIDGGRYVVIPAIPNAITLATWWLAPSAASVCAPAGRLWHRRFCG